jgi:FeS assembly protein IscX
VSVAWTDVHAIGEMLYDRFPELDPLGIRFTDLRQWVLEIPEFDDNPDRCGEKVLEAIQMAWLSEWKEDQ